MVYIRTDANETIATGHVMRCMTIADQLVRLGEEVVFVVSDQESTTLIKNKGYKCIVLDSDWSNPMNPGECCSMKMLLENHKERPKLLIDSYSIRGEYSKELRKYAKVLVIDDLFEEDFDADVIINYTLYHTRFDYEGRYRNRSKLLLGGEYVPLREQFSDRDFVRNVKDTGTYKILMICGGGDKYNALGAILEGALSGKYRELSAKCEFHVVVGVYNPHTEMLKELARKQSNIRLYNNVSDMAKLMAECDMAVSAASTVLYECCAMKLPTVFFCVADNQQYDKECFTKNDVMIYAGDIRIEKKQCVDNILRAVENLTKHTDVQKHMIDEMSVLIDGRGAIRIAECIAAL